MTAWCGWAATKACSASSPVHADSVQKVRHPGHWPRCTGPGAAPLGADFDAYAEAVSALAADEVASIEVAAANAGAGEDRAALSEAAVVGIVLFERALIALRRLAREGASARRFGRLDPAGPAGPAGPESPATR
jgi:hypothetical protein